MKIGIITKPNQKGQVVIPKKIREEVGITPGLPLNVVIQGQGVLLQPIKGVIHGVGASAYLKVLEKTRGTWRQSDWRSYRQRRVRELAGVRKRKTAW